MYFDCSVCTNINVKTQISDLRSRRLLHLFPSDQLLDSCDFLKYFRHTEVSWCGTINTLHGHILKLCSLTISGNPCCSQRRYTEVLARWLNSCSPKQAFCRACCFSHLFVCTNVLIARPQKKAFIRHKTKYLTWRTWQQEGSEQSRSSVVKGFISGRKGRKFHHGLVKLIMHLVLYKGG